MANHMNADPADNNMNADPADNLLFGIQVRAYHCADCVRNRCTGCPLCQSPAALFADEVMTTWRSQISTLQEQIRLLQERKQQHCVCHWDVQDWGANGEEMRYVCRRCAREVDWQDRELVDQAMEDNRRRWALGGGLDPLPDQGEPSDSAESAATSATEEGV